MKKYEYKLLTISATQLKKSGFQADLDQKFQDFGNDGWELVSMEGVSVGGFLFSSSYTREFIAVFKREK